MNKLTIQKRVQILASLVEGNSIRSTVCMTGAAKNGVVIFLREVRQVCEQYHNKVIVNLPCNRISGHLWELEDIVELLENKEKSN